MSDVTATPGLGTQGIGRRPLAALAAGPTGAACAVVLLCLATLAVFDVPLTQSVPYLGYELGFVVIPGIVVTLAVTGARRLGLQEVALGIGIGYGVELLAFVATASLGYRSLFPWFPLVVVALSLPFVRARPTLGSVQVPGGAAWWLAAIMAALVGFLANSILDTAIPQHVYSLVGYPTDMLWSTSVTAEAMHHWPLQIPGFAGDPLYYHYFAYLHTAGAARVTGLSPWLLNFRLFPLWSLLLAAFELYVFAKSLSGRRLAGLIAPFTLLVAGNFLPWGASQQIVSETYLSITFAYGMIIWIPLLMAARLAAQPEGSGYRRGAAWVLLAALAVTASGAKAPIIVLAGTGFALAALTSLRGNRREGNAPRCRDRSRNRRLRGRVVRSSTAARTGR